MSRKLLLRFPKLKHGRGGFDYRDLDLQSFTELHSVSFNQVSVGHSRVRASFRVLLGLLSNLHPETVTSVTIGMIFCGISLADLDIDWQGLQTVLEQLKGLREIILPIPCMRGGGASKESAVVQWEHLVRESLPVLNERGLLRIGG